MTQPTQPANGLTTAAFVLGAIALLVFPIFLGPAGIILAAIGLSKGEARAVSAMIFCACATVVGIFMGAFMVGFMAGLTGT